MAWAYATDDLTVVVKFRDWASGEVERRYKVIFDTDIATTLANALAALPTIVGLTDANVSEASISVKMTDDAAVAAVSEKEVETNAAISMYIDPTTEKTWTTEVPAPKLAIFAGASGQLADTVDIADPAVVAFAGLFQTTGGVFSVSDGETVDDTTPLAGGKRVHRRSRKS